MNKNLLTNQNFLGQIGQLGQKGTKQSVLFLRHTHKDQAWKLRVGTHLRFKSEDDLFYLRITQFKINYGSIYCNESVSVNWGISVLRCVPDIYFSFKLFVLKKENIVLNKAPAALRGPCGTFAIVINFVWLAVLFNWRLTFVPWTSWVSVSVVLAPYRDIILNF